MRKINGINFNIELELDWCMRHMYTGSYQYEITNLLKKFLRKGDTFIDVGANVGYFSAVALGLVGKTGEVHSFEPVPKYYKRLKTVHENNLDFNINVNEVACGEEEGITKISVANGNNIGWNTMVPNFMHKDSIEEEIEISVITLDSYLTQKNIKNVRLVKMDTEGYEFPVMKGFQQYLRGLNELPILVIEVVPEAYDKLKLTLADFADLMVNLGYVAYDFKLANLIEVAQLVAPTTDVVFLPKNLCPKNR